MTWQDSVADLTPFRGVHFPMSDRCHAGALVKCTARLARTPVPPSTTNSGSRSAAVDGRLEEDCCSFATSPRGLRTEQSGRADLIAALGPADVRWIRPLLWRRARRCYAPNRNTGTLPVSAKHQVLSSPLCEGHRHTCGTLMTSLAKGGGLRMRVNGFADHIPFHHRLLAGPRQTRRIGGRKTKRASTLLLGFLG